MFIVVSDLFLHNWCDYILLTKDSLFWRWPWQRAHIKRVMSISLCWWWRKEWFLWLESRGHSGSQLTQIFLKSRYKTSVCLQYNKFFKLFVDVYFSIFIVFHCNVQFMLCVLKRCLSVDFSHCHLIHIIMAIKWWFLLVVVVYCHLSPLFWCVCFRGRVHVQATEGHHPIGTRAWLCAWWMAWYSYWH